PPGADRNRRLRCDRLDLPRTLDAVVEPGVVRAAGRLGPAGGFPQALNPATGRLQLQLTRRSIRRTIAVPAEYPDEQARPTPPGSEPSGPVASRQLARAPRAADAHLSGRRGAGRGPGGATLAAAAGDLVGDPGAQAAAGRGPGGQALPAPGWRLRGELRRVQLGRHLQPAQGAAADEPGAGARPEAAGGARGPLRRPVRQAAFGR